MRTFLVWPDEKRYSQKDGEEIEAVNAYTAATNYGWDRFNTFQHVDPGRFWVLEKGKDGALCFAVKVRVELHVEPTKGIYE